MMTDILVANVEESPAILAEMLPSSKWAALSGWKGLEPAKMQSLTNIAASTLKRSSHDLKMPLIGGDKTGGPLLLEVGVEFRDLFSAISPAQARTIADAWAKTEELRTEGWTQAESRQFVQELVKISTSAKTRGKNLLLWMTW
jgi:hypothetical protein